MIKIITYNILAQRFYKYSGDKKTKYFDWDYRKQLIINILIKNDADIICLQEVELANFKVDFNELFNRYDYFGHEITKKRVSPIGNIILWKKNVFNGNDCVNTSCSNKITFEYIKTGYNFKFCNVHLKAGINSDESIKARISQLKSVNRLDGDIICGDFNDDFKNNNGIIDLIDELNYKIYNTYKTCCVIDGNDAHYWCFDNIMTKKNFDKEIKIEKCKSMSNLRIPDTDNPSDHIPLIFMMSI